MWHGKEQNQQNRETMHNKEKYVTENGESHCDRLLTIFVFSISPNRDCVIRGRRLKMDLPSLPGTRNVTQYLPSGEFVAESTKLSGRTCRETP